MKPRAAAVLAVAGLAVVPLVGGCGWDGAAESGPERPRDAAAAASAARPSAAPTTASTLLVADFGSDTVTFVEAGPEASEPGQEPGGEPGQEPGREPGQEPGREPGHEPGGEPRPAASVEVGTAPYGLVVGADGRAWVATAEGVAVVDTRTRESLGRIPYRTAAGPATHGEYRGGGMGIALAPDGKHVYVGVNVPGRTGVLEVIDTATRKVTDTVPVGRRPFDVDVSPDGSEVYATGHDSFDVTAVRTGKGKGKGKGGGRGGDSDSLESRRMEVAPYGTEGGLGSWLKPHYAVVRPDGRLLLPFEGERLAVLDPRTGAVDVERMTADTHQHGATLTRDGTLLIVGTGPIGPKDRTRTSPRHPTAVRRTSPAASPARAPGTASPSSTSTAAIRAGCPPGRARSASRCWTHGAEESGWAESGGRSRVGSAGWAVPGGQCISRIGSSVWMNGLVYDAQLQLQLQLQLPLQLQLQLQLPLALVSLPLRPSPLPRCWRSRRAQASAASAASAAHRARRAYAIRTSPGSATAATTSSTTP